MKELLNALPTQSWQEINNIALIDTCFLIDELKKHRDDELGQGLGLLSFNAEELLHVTKHMHDKKHFRQFFKHHTDLLLVNMPVHPGNAEAEKQFVASIDPHLLKLIPDPSDAVLLAVAVARKCPVLTKDKHHLFTTVLENYVKDFGIRVFKEMKDYLAWKETK